MDQRHVITLLVAVLVIAGAGFWWYQGYVRYAEFSAREVVIAGQVFDVERFEGVISPDDPGQMRACFRIDRPVTAPPALDPRPTAGPEWFKCFDPEFLSAMLAAGKARAYVAARDEPKGYDRLIVVLPGGRVYMWREPNGS